MRKGDFVWFTVVGIGYLDWFALCRSCNLSPVSPLSSEFLRP